jgi:alkylhydroperoxidase family enzyme
MSAKSIFQRFVNLTQKQGHTIRRSARRLAKSVRPRLQRMNFSLRKFERLQSLQQRIASLRVAIKEPANPTVQSEVPSQLTASPDFTESLLQRSVERRLHALVQLRCAARLACDTTAEARAQLCRFHGWPLDLIQAVRVGGNHSALTDRENVVLRYADDITRTPIDVDLQVLRELRRYFSSEQIQELTAAICYENFRTRYNNALRMEQRDRIEDGSSQPASQTSNNSFAEELHYTSMSRS